MKAKNKNIVYITPELDENLSDLETIERLIYILKKGDEFDQIKLFIKNSIKNYFLFIKNKK